MTKHNQKLRWTAATFVFFAVWCHAFDLYPTGPILHLIGATLWVLAALPKREGPILLNFTPQIIIWSSGLIWYFFF